MVQTWRQRRCRTYFETPPWGERDHFRLNHLCSATNFDVIAEYWCPNLAWAWWTTIIHGYLRCCTDQWSLRAWRKAESPSITSRMDTVRTANRPKAGTRSTTPQLVSTRRPSRITIAHNTSESSGSQQNTFSILLFKMDHILAIFNGQFALDWLLQTVSTILDVWI